MSTSEQHFFPVGDCVRGISYSARILVHPIVSDSVKTHLDVVQLTSAAQHSTQSSGSSKLLYAIFRPLSTFSPLGPNIFLSTHND
jgi:hypothetical protein